MGGRQRHARKCRRCGKTYMFSNLMNRRRVRAAIAKPREWGDPIEHDDFNVHTLACARRRGEVILNV